MPFVVDYGLILCHSVVTNTQRSKQMTLVTKDGLQAMLDTADADKRTRIIGRALVVLFKRQTADERQNNDVNVENGVGFTGADGESGCIGAKYFIKHGTLLDWVVDKWMKKNDKGFSRLVKYHKQLNEAAEAKVLEKTG